MKGTIVADPDCRSCQCSCVNKLFESELIYDFSRAVRNVQYKKGETILKQSTFANNILFLKSGIVKLVLESVNMKETIFQLALPGSFVGLSVLYSTDFVPFSVIALKDCSVCLIKKEILEALLPESKKATKFVLSSYNEESHFLLHRISVLNTRNNHGKLAEALLYTSSPEMKSESVTRFLTRNDWADLSAISLESVNKIFSELKNDLIIKITNDGVEICNYELLMRLSRIG